MRLRQVALASRDLDLVAGQLRDVFGLNVAYNDPGIHHYGLKNAVLPAGYGFIEVVQPIREDASAARFLARRGGDAGYMVILQTADAEAERARVVALGVRVVDDIDSAHYRCAHFHPADFGGVLVSFDQQRTETDPLVPDGDWWPAGPDWREARSGDVSDVAAVTLATGDPDALARRWSERLDRPLDPSDPGRLPLDRGVVRFVRARGSDTATTIRAIDLEVADIALITRRARSAGLDIDPDGVLIGGVRFRPVT